MALSDCIECWQTPCICGHGYKGWGEAQKAELVKAVQGYNTKDLLLWAESKGYLKTSSEQIINEYKQEKDG